MATRKKRSPAKPASAPPRAGPPPAPLTQAIRVRAAIIVLAGVIAYSNSFSGPFVLDDQGAIVENAQIRRWWPLTSVLFPEANSSGSGRGRTLRSRVCLRFLAASLSREAWPLPRSGGDMARARRPHTVRAARRGGRVFERGDGVDIPAESSISHRPLLAPGDLAQRAGR